MDPDPDNPLSPLKTTVSLPVASGTNWISQEVSRIYHITDVSSSGHTTRMRLSNANTRGRNFTASSNLVTDTESFVTDDYTSGLPYSIAHSDGTTTSYSYPDPYTTIRNDPDGSETTNVVDAWGKPLSETKIDLGTGVVLENKVYTYTNGSGQLLLDPLEPQLLCIADLAGRTTHYIYDCCNLDSVVDPDYVSTGYSYDPMKRRVATSVYYGGTNAITTTNILDAAGRVLVTNTGAIDTTWSDDAVLHAADRL